MTDLRNLVPCPIAELQRQLSMSYEHLWGVLAGRRLASPELAIRIEDATGGSVTRGMLRPDLWPVEHEVAS